jgi:hypothetical protein
MRDQKNRVRQKCQKRGQWGKQTHSVQDITDVSRLRNVSTVGVTQIRRARVCTTTAFRRRDRDEKVSSEGVGNGVHVKANVDRGGVALVRDSKSGRVVADK